MSPPVEALLLFAAVVVLVVATRSRRLHPFLAIVAVASAFGLAVGYSVGFLGKTFGTGFAQAIYSPGLVLVAAGFVAGIAECTAASERLMAAIERWGPMPGRIRLSSFLGLIAGIGASPGAAFALLTPLLPALGGRPASERTSAATALALAISASHGLLLPGPVQIAAVSILGAAWGRVALLGLAPLLAAVAVGAAVSRWRPVAEAAPQPAAAPESEQHKGGSAIVLLLATLVPLICLMVQSLGDIPSEPFGGGGARERLLGVGRPLFLLLVGVGIMLIGHWRRSLPLLADFAWTERILGRVAGLLIVVGAAGGLERLCQESGMAELLAERVSGWHIPVAAAVLVPFLIAATMKTLQGSSLVAAIAAAGMMQPLLLPLGLAGDSGKALATLAIGAGAMTMSHVNDDYFWLVSGGAGMRPLQALTRITGGTLLQGIAALAVLLLLSLIFSG